jgi:hypothetical protein
MSAQSFQDLREADFKRFDRASEQRARLALLRSATATNDHDEADDTVDAATRDDERKQRLIADYGHTTDAASLLLAGANCPPEHRGFIDAVVGIAGGRTDWFSVTDKIIATRGGRSTKWVQMHRKELLEWETAHDTTFIEIEDSYTDADNTHHAHKYRVHLAAFAADTKLDAEHSTEWRMNPGKALEEAAKTYRDSIPTMPPRRKRRRTRTPNNEELIERELKRARTCLEKVLNLQPMDGSRAEMNTDLLATLQAQLAQLTGASTYAESNVQTSTTLMQGAVETGHREQPTAEAERVEVGEVETDDNSLLEKSSTRENIDPNADFEDLAADNTQFFDAPPDDYFDDAPPDFDTLLTDDDLDDDDLEIIAAERAAIQDEANGLPLEPDEVLAKTAELPKPPKVKISTAQPTTTPPTTTATITTSPPIDEAVERGEKTLNAVAKETKQRTEKAITAKPEKPTEQLDKTGYPIPDSILDDWNRADETSRLMLSQISKLKSQLKAGLDNKGIIFAEVTNTSIADFTNAYSSIKCVVPYAVCTSCQGHHRKQCSLCRTRGFISEFAWRSFVPSEVKALRCCESMKHTNDCALRREPLTTDNE